MAITRSSGKSMDDKNDSSRKKPVAGKGSSTSDPAKTDTSALRRSARVTAASKVPMSSSPSTLRKSERLEKKRITPSKRKLENQNTVSPLRRSDRAKKQHSSSCKKSDKGSGSPDDRGNNLKQLEQEAQEISRSKKHPKTTVVKNRMDARTYTSLFTIQRKRASPSELNKESDGPVKLSEGEESCVGATVSKQGEEDDESHEVIERRRGLLVEVDVNTHCEAAHKSSHTLERSSNAEELENNTNNAEELEASCLSEKHNDNNLGTSGIAASKGKTHSDENCALTTVSKDMGISDTDTSAPVSSSRKRDDYVTACVEYNKRQRVDYYSVQQELCFCGSTMEKHLQRKSSSKVTPIGGSGREIMGNILDDFVRQIFGVDSYERLDGGYLPTKKRQVALDKFNDKGRGRFVHLLENSACLYNVKLSSVNAIIIYDSDSNPINDSRALCKLPISPSSRKIKVFRLYRSCTIEERVIDLTTYNLTLDSKLLGVCPSTIHKLLMLGAAYLFGKLHEFSRTSSVLSLQNDVGKEFSAALLCWEGENVHTDNSLIIKVLQAVTKYSEIASLFDDRKVKLVDLEDPRFWRNRKRLKNSDDLPNKPDGDAEESPKKRMKLVNNGADPASHRESSSEDTLIGSKEEWFLDSGMHVVVEERSENQDIGDDGLLPQQKQQKDLQDECLSSPATGVRDEEEPAGVNQGAVQGYYGQTNHEAVVVVIEREDRPQNIPHQADSISTTEQTSRHDPKTIPPSQQSEEDNANLATIRSQPDDVELAVRNNSQNAEGWSQLVENTTDRLLPEHHQSNIRINDDCSLPSPDMDLGDGTVNQLLDIEECMSFLPPTQGILGTQFGINLPLQSQPVHGDPLQYELERIRKETENAVKIHQDSKMQLQTQYEKLIDEIRRQYEAKVQAAEEVFVVKKKELHMHHEQVVLNKTLAEAFRSKFIPSVGFGMQQQAMPSSFMVSSHTPPGRPSPVVSAWASLVANPAVVSTPTNHYPSSMPNRLLHGGGGVPANLSPSGNRQLSGEIHAPAPHLQQRWFRPSPPMAAAAASSPLPWALPNHHSFPTRPAPPRAPHPNMVALSPGNQKMLMRPVENNRTVMPNNTSFPAHLDANLGSLNLTQFSTVDTKIHNAAIPGSATDIIYLSDDE